MTSLIVLAMGAMAMLQVRLMYTPKGVGHETSGSLSAPVPDLKLPPAGAPDALLLPVYGVSTRQLNDTWGAARSAGRTHEGIDIMAPAGTPVRAAGPGKLLKLFRSDRGGITAYQANEDGRYIFYYAHMERYAPDLKEGEMLARGQVLGFVGMTGNAPVPHLHFEIQRAPADGKWWRGEAFNPYPSLLAGRVVDN